MRVSNREAAFDAYFRIHFVPVLRFVERRILNRETAHEIAAECLVIAWQKFDPGHPPRIAWLYQTARNLLGNAYRKRAREASLLELLKDRARFDTPDPELVLLEEAMDRLRSLDQEALRLTYWEQLSAAEVGQVLGCSEQAAWKRISRAKEAVKSQLESASIWKGGMRT